MSYRLISLPSKIGTVNYMSPEAIELPDGMRRLKVGRPSDVWSLGCILYQMVYGHPPFQHLSVYQKMKAIPDLTHVIDFAEYATPTVPSPRTSSSGNGQVDPPKKLDHLKQRVRKDVIMSMKSCLCRNPKERATIPELLNHGWLAMQERMFAYSLLSSILLTSLFCLASPPPAKELLKENEAIINPYYMHQLLEYGIKLASEGGIDAQSLLKDAEVRLLSLYCQYILTNCLISGSCKSLNQFNHKSPLNISHVTQSSHRHSSNIGHFLSPASMLCHIHATVSLVCSNCRRRTAVVLCVL